MNRSLRFIAVAVSLTVLTACSRVQRDWRVAQKADTAQAYEGFVRSHPDSELAAVARQRAAQLTEEAAWRQATSVNTAAAYEDYLAKYPNGSWSQDARIRMESRSLASQQPQGTGQAVAAPVPGGTAISQGASGPAGGSQRGAGNLSGRSSPADTANLAAAVAVQLGAFSSVVNAHSAWSQLSSKFGPELRGLSPQVVPVTSSGRRLYRLEARVASLAAARRLCHQLQQRSQGCLPVP